MLLKFYYLHILFFVASVVVATGTCQLQQKSNRQKPVETDTLQHQLGDNTILIKRSKSIESTAYVYLQLHHNEQTAEEATLQFIQNNPGTFINIINNNQRNIKFSYSGNEYTIDPNRIYTAGGIDSTLKNLSTYNADAAKAVATFARFILSLLPDTTIIVAVHNNTDENYSIKDYLKGGSLQNDAEDVYLNPALDTDDFILTTEREFFEKLKSKNINVILQSKNAVNDGSLSVYSAKMGIKYLNIEAQAGHLKQQLQMLQAVKEIITP